jgi:hypothetical protein
MNRVARGRHPPWLVSKAGKRLQEGNCLFSIQSSFARKARSQFIADITLRFGSHRTSGSEVTTAASGVMQRSLQFPRPDVKLDKLNAPMAASLHRP